MNVHKSWYYYGIILILFILCGVLYINMNQNDKTLELTKTDQFIQESYANESISHSPPMSEDEKETEPLQTDLRVYICGAVNNPDVYILPSGSVIKDALKKAGGATEEADLEAINLALEITDQDKIYIPRQGETFDKSQNKDENNKSNHLKADQNDDGIHINSATMEQLEELPGIGEVKANAIIQYREEHGAFQSIEEIQNVSGIGAKTLEKIKSFIIVD